MNTIIKYSDMKLSKLRFHIYPNYLSIFTKGSEKLILQTPKLVVPYNIYTFQSGSICKRYLYFSYTHHPQFYELIQSLYQLIKEQLPPSIQFHHTHCLKAQLVETTTFFNSQKHNIPLSIQPHTLATALLELSGVSIRNQKARCVWIVHQLKTHHLLPTLCHIQESNETMNEICPNCLHEYYSDRSSHSQQVVIQEKTTTISSETNPFLKMLRLGVPKIAVTQKMKCEGYSDTEITQLLSQSVSKSKRTTGGITASPIKSHSRCVNLFAAIRKGSRLKQSSRRKRPPIKSTPKGIQQDKNQCVPSLELIMQTLQRLKKTKKRYRIKQ